VSGRERAWRSRAWPIPTGGLDAHPRYDRGRDAPPLAPARSGRERSIARILPDPSARGVPPWVPIPSWTTSPPAGSRAATSIAPRWAPAISSSGSLRRSCSAPPRSAAAARAGWPRGTTSRASCPGRAPRGACASTRWPTTSSASHVHRGAPSTHSGGDP
jgi:hypothetical protein